jgi:phosphatidylethanolamine/phosphatidyl-N-methylethanolamine N-methyltransferase
MPGEKPIPAAPGLFLREFIRSFRLTASVAPSSRFLTAALCEPLDFDKARVIAEFGPGTGPVTNGILARMHPDAVLYAIDMNPVFIGHLKRSCKDKRLLPVLGSAADLNQIVGGASEGCVDAVVSSLGLTSMDNRLRRSIYDQVKQCLRPGGVLTQYQYATSKAGCKIARSDFDERRFLESYFDKVTTKWVLANFPPACVFTCVKG